MTEHYSEADLLETYYTQPGESVPVMLHLARCPDCAARFHRLEQKLRDLASCDTEKPETFWVRQRAAVMSRVARSTSVVPYAFRVAAAAVLAVILGGVVLQRSERQVVDPQVVVEDTSVPSDPWDSEELKEFEAVVEWESWIEEDKKAL